MRTAGDGSGYSLERKDVHKHIDERKFVHSDGRWRRSVINDHVRRSDVATEADVRSMPSECSSAFEIDSDFPESYLREIRSNASEDVDAVEDAACLPRVERRCGLGVATCRRYGGHRRRRGPGRRGFRWRRGRQAPGRVRSTHPGWLHGLLRHPRPAAGILSHPRPAAGMVCHRVRRGSADDGVEWARDGGDGPSRRDHRRRHRHRSRGLPGGGRKTGGTHLARPGRWRQRWGRGVGADAGAGAARHGLARFA